MQKGIICNDLCSNKKKNGDKITQSTTKESGESINFIHGNPVENVN